MGMFDTVKFDGLTTLPEFTHGDINDFEWQTKGIEDPAMWTYVIRGKKLFKIKHEWEEVPMGERVHIDGFGSVPLVQPKKTWEVDMNHHGKFTFYTLIQDEGENGLDHWYEYEAKFTDGELQNIRIIRKDSEFRRRVVTLPHE